MGRMFNYDTLRVGFDERFLSGVGKSQAPAGTKFHTVYIELEDYREPQIKMKKIMGVALSIPAHKTERYYKYSGDNPHISAKASQTNMKLNTFMPNLLVFFSLQGFYNDRDEFQVPGHVVLPEVYFMDDPDPNKCTNLYVSIFGHSRNYLRLNNSYMPMIRDGIHKPRSWKQLCLNSGDQFVEFYASDSLLSTIVLDSLVMSNGEYKYYNYVIDGNPKHIGKICNPKFMHRHLEREKIPINDLYYR